VIETTYDVNVVYDMLGQFGPPGGELEIPIGIPETRVYFEEKNDDHDNPETTPTV
jgi:hypothetical protein